MMKLPYEDWKCSANRWSILICGMDTDDLDDMPWSRWYEEGVSAKAAARRAIKWTQRGYRPDFAD